VTVPNTIEWDDSSRCIRFIDQTKLPDHLTIVECKTVSRLVAAIQRLEIRGAPLLGVAGAFGVALAAVSCKKTNYSEFIADVRNKAKILSSIRPTAINLNWGINRVLAAMEQLNSVTASKKIAIVEAKSVAQEDIECCRSIGEFGTTLLPDKCTVLTHCNAGALACTSWGTALGVIRSAVQRGKDVKVLSCETRPLLQGARLTSWELSQDGIDVTVITDSMAAYLMRKGEIDCVIVGADRITRDSVFNKIGTYMHAVCAHHHNIPFYVAAPISTFDPDKLEGEIIIEERGREEITTCGNRTIVPDGVKVRNLAFDATPMDLISAIITEKGILKPPIDMQALFRYQTIM
jgi:methylthioribose-1-phosphate isomerase